MSASPENMVGGANKPSLVMKFAQKYNIVEATLLTTLKQTCFRQSEGEVSNEQMVALLVVADQYNLNPFTKEIYAFPDKNKGIVPVVSVDGWIRIVNEHEDYNGYDVVLPGAMTSPTDERPACWEWVTIRMHRKNVEFTPDLTEYLDECYRKPFIGKYRDSGKEYTINGPWQSHPKRMLRHKAFIQAARAVFGFSGIYDEDEAQRIIESRQADPAVVAVQESGKGTRTASAAEALRAKMGITDKSGEVNPLATIQGAQDQAVVAEQTPAKTEAPAAKTGGMQENRRDKFRYDVETAVTALRACGSLEDLKRVFDMIQDDYDFSAREMPVDIDANYRDRKESLEQEQSR